MPKKYSDTEKQQNRARYMQSRTGDLTSYAALIGEGFATKINLLAQIIKDAHEPSLGAYKERLLMSVLSQFIPRKYEVGTGFVLFPSEKQFDGDIPEGYDVLNRSDHIVSRQCDIIVYDSNEFPVVFKDGDFVVVRPESVRSVIEVKGSLDSSEIDSFMNHFIDFGRKWKRCNDFYREHTESVLGEPSLSMMAWQVGVDTRGRPKTDGGRLREKITQIYKDELKKNELERFPVIEAAYIYNDCEVKSLINLDEKGYGFGTYNGKFVRFDEDNEAYENGDKTIASLLAGVHWSLETPFNRFFSYADQTNRTNLFPHKNQGFSRWLEDDEIKLLGWSKAPRKH
jgi:hypothetical protein